MPFFIVMGNSKDYYKGYLDFEVDGTMPLFYSKAFQGTTTQLKMVTYLDFEIDEFPF